MASFLFADFRIKAFWISLTFYTSISKKVLQLLVYLIRIETIIVQIMRVSGVLEREEATCPARLGKRQAELAVHISWQQYA